MKIWEILDSENVEKIYLSESLGVEIAIEMHDFYPYALIIKSLDCDSLGSNLEDIFKLKAILNAEFTEVID